MMSGENIKTILLVEDEAIVSMMEKVSLEKCGYAVITADTGEKAIAAFKENTSVDLILMDIDLGRGINGPDAATAILGERDIPIIFLSSHMEPEIVEKTEKITSYGYVVKNSGITVLNASIKMAFKLFEANKLIVASEIKQKTLISNISDVIGIIGVDGIMKYKSLNMEKWFGWLPEDLVGTDGWQTVHPDDLERVQKEFFTLLEIDNAVTTVEYRYKCKDGSYKPIELTATNLTSDPNIRGVLLNYHDITERRRAEAAVWESEAKYRAAFMTSPEAININAVNGRYVDINEGFTILSGFTREDVIGRLSSEIKIWSIPEDREKLVKGLMEAGSVENLESTFKCKDGSLKTCLMSARFIRIKGEPHILSITRDITERRQLEEALYKDQSTTRILLDASPAFFIAIDLDGRVRTMNRALLKTLELSESEAKGLDYLSTFVHEDDKAVVSEVFHKLAREGKPTTNENRIISTSGKEYLVEWTGRPIYRVDDSLDFFVGIGIDISEHRRAEDALRVSETKFRILFDSTSDAVMLLDEKGFFDCNKSTLALYGCATLDEFCSKHPADFSPAEQPCGTDSMLLANRMLATAREQGSIHFEWMHRRNDTGETFPADVLLTAIEINGKPVIEAVVRDITERKRAEEKLLEIEGRYRALFDRSLDCVYVCDFEGRFIDANDATLNLLGYTREEICDLNFASLLSEDQLPIAFEELKDLRETGSQKRLIEYRLRSKNGDEVFVESKGSAILSNGVYTAIQAVARDITERKKSEEKIKSLLAEKELILKEVHHRIKNNMSIINAFLFLQAQTLKEPAAIAALQDAEGRVQSMMVLYDKLFRSVDFRAVSMKEYLSPLIDDIAANFPSSISVKIEKEIDDFMLDASILQPLGIIINELVSNIMKYAFTGRDSGAIIIEAGVVRAGLGSVPAAAGHDRVTVVIRDNGIGMPESVDFENTTGFGFVLVGMLVKQIGGTIRIEREKGTANILEFGI